MKEELLLEYLKTVCPGRGRIQKSAQMERALQISGNELRRLVHRLRKRGVPIASSRDGYFYAVTAGEVYTTIRQLRQMACGLEKAIAGLEGSLERFGQGTIWVPAEAQRSGFGGGRRNDGAGELPADRRERASAVRDDDGSGDDSP